MGLDPKRFEIPSRTTYKLERMLSAAAETDHPELGRRTILVAGTNGKGSTCTWLTHLLKVHGLKVGTYSSPHVVDVTERIRIQGKPISVTLLKKFERDFADILEPLTYFERLTLLGFLIFRAEKVDVQVIEVGIGGRLDAANICDPDFSAITSIDDDHKDVLGPTPKHIASEKAGIMRQGRACYLHPQRPLVRRVLQKEADRAGTPLCDTGEIRFSPKLESLLKRLEKKWGPYQGENIRSALSLFQDAAFDWGLSVKYEKIEKALSDSLWTARCEVLRKNPIVLVDGAHNAHAVRALASRLKNGDWTREKWTIVFGAMNDKPLAEMLRLLKPFAREFIFPTYYPERQARAESLRRIASKISRTIPSKILRDSRDLGPTFVGMLNSKHPILVVGSFYLAGAALKALKKSKWQ